MNSLTDVYFLFGLHVDNFHSFINIYLVHQEVNNSMNRSIDLWKALDVAREIIAHAECSDDKPIAVTIAGPNGVPIITMAMDEVMPISVGLSQRKAYTSIMTQEDTLVWEKAGVELTNFVDSKITCFAGGVLVRDPKGNILCAIGVSGRKGSCRKRKSPPQDHELALHGQGFIKRQMEE